MTLFRAGCELHEALNDLKNELLSRLPITNITNVDVSTLRLEELSGTKPISLLTLKAMKRQYYLTDFGVEQAVDFALRNGIDPFSAAEVLTWDHSPEVFISR